MTAYTTGTQSHTTRGGLLSAFADRAIGAKVSLGFSAVLVITLALSILSYLSLNGVGDKFNAYAQRVHVVAIASDVDRDFLWLRNLAREFALTGEESLLEEARQQRELVQKEIATGIAEIKDPARLAKMKDVKERLAGYEEIFGKIVAARREQDHLLTSVLEPSGVRMRADLEKIQALATGKDGGGDATSLSDEAMKNLLLMRLSASKTLTRHNPLDFEAAIKFHNDLRAGLASIAAPASNGELARQANDLSSLAKQYYEAFETAARDFEFVTQSVNQIMKQQGESLSADIAAIKTSGANEEKAIQGETESLISFNETLSIVLSLAGLAVGVSLAFVIGRAIAKPVRAMTEAMTALAGGDLKVEIPARDNRDEIGGMARALSVFKEAAVEKIRRDAEVETERSRAQEERRRTEEEAIRREREMVANSIGAGLAKLSANDLTARMTGELPEAYRRLQADFNAATSQLEAAMSVVANGAQAIGAGVNQIATASDDLSRRTEQQAASLEETAAALEEITVTVKKTADGAVDASAIVGTAKAEAERSGAIVRQAVDAMGRIEKSSQQIGQIIGVIDEIAFQTNLLALNAGVEAARAGDAGRGFAVVASEVRALAQRSAEAAKEIKGLISTSSAEVDQGVELVGQTGKALKEIVAKVCEIDKVVSAIASGAKDEAISLAEVNNAVTQMDQSTQQNAALVEQATAASYALRKEVEELIGSVGGFELDRSPAAKAGAAQRHSMNAAPRLALKTVAGPRGGNAARNAAPAQESWEEF